MSIELVAITGITIAALGLSSGPPTLNAQTRFFAPLPETSAVEQIIHLLASRDIADAAHVADMATTPHAVWFQSGTPSQVKESVRETVTIASLERRVPVLVSYNIPFRDCAQYSAGGATDNAAYEAWIDAFAAGIGNAQAMVILEPDSLGIIPYNTTIFGASEWCQPTVTDANGNAVAAPGADPTDRYALVNYAVDSLAAKAPNAYVYLDATHSAWLGVGEAAYRLQKAGVARARGFFVNVSNYQLTSDSEQFSVWISDTLAAAANGPSWAYDSTGMFHFDWLPSQYDPATNYTTVNYSASYAAGVTSAIEGFMNGSTATSHFVVDTSRNGNGPLNTAPYAAAPYNQPANVISALASGNWCNPPGAVVGLAPSASTDQPLIDAYLWVKIPGESDGQCDSAGGARAWNYTLYDPWGITGDAETQFDPLWGQVDPAAGVWFGAQAVQLAKTAVAPLL